MSTPDKPRSSFGDFDLEEHQPAPTRWPPAARAAAAIGSGCVLLIALEMVVLRAVFERLAMPAPANAKATVSAPARVRVGKTFPLTVTIKNPGNVPLKVATIHADQDLLGEVQLANPLPAPESAPKHTNGSLTWSFNRSIAAQGSFAVKFEAKARRPGEVTKSLEINAGGRVQSPWFTVNADTAPDSNGKHR